MVDCVISILSVQIAIVAVWYVQRYLLSSMVVYLSLHFFRWRLFFLIQPRLSEIVLDDPNDFVFTFDNGMVAGLKWFNVKLAAIVYGTVELSIRGCSYIAQ